MPTEANFNIEDQKIQKKKTKNFPKKKSEAVFEIKFILRQTQSYYKVYWLSFDLTHDNWFFKKETKENALEI